MARISFTSGMEEIIGKFGGNVFQDSYFGIQLRGLTKPRNPQTQLQQLRRGDFGFLSASWRYLSGTDQATWIAEAGTIPEALRLFLGNNVNLILTGIPAISSFTTGATPGDFPLEITELTDTEFTVSASTGTTIVPAGTNLLLYATPGKADNKQFTNPSEYYPLIHYPAASDFGTPVSIYSTWIGFFGLLLLNRHICIKTALVNSTNGNRGTETIACANSPLLPSNDIIDDSGNKLIDSDGTFIIYP
jgi:hypothetical protein